MRAHVVVSRDRVGVAVCCIHWAHPHTLPTRVTRCIQWVAYSQVCVCVYACVCARVCACACAAHVNHTTPLVSPSSFTSFVISPFPSSGGKFTTSACFHSTLRSLPPSSHKMLQPGDSRDALFDGLLLHTLQLEYELKLSGKASVTLSVPSLHSMLDDSPVASHLWLIKTCNGRVISWGEALYDYDVSLADGTYTIVLRVTGEDPKQLEDDYKHTVVSACIALDAVLDCSVSLDGPHASHSKEQSVTLHSCQQRTVYVIPPRASKLPKIVKVG